MLDKKTPLANARLSTNGRAAPDQRGDAYEGYDLTSTANVLTLADVPRRTIDWLWPGWIPRGAITILDGDPDKGKSTITLDLAARVSRGWAMPPQGGASGRAPADVLLLSAEDDLGATVRPRLEAAGADLHRVHSLDSFRQGGINRPPVLPEDLDKLREEMNRRDAALVIVDPFLAYLSGHIDAHRDQDVRRALHRLRDLAQETGAAILPVRHLNKLGAGTALYRGGGSIGIIGAARSGLLVGRHPDDPVKRVLASMKSNLGPAPRSLTYSLESTGDVARIAWGEECDLTADDILAQPDGSKRSRGEPEDRRDLLDLIQSRGGEISARDLAHASRRFRASGAADSALEALAREGTGYWHTVTTGGRPARVFRLGNAGNGNGRLVFPECDGLSLPLPACILEKGPTQ